MNTVPLSYIEPLHLIPERDHVAHLIDDHGLTVRDIAVLFRCREDLLRGLLVENAERFTSG